MALTHQFVLETRRVGLGFHVNCSVSRLAELGVNSVSQKGIKGLEFKAVLIESFLRLSKLIRGSLAIHARWNSSS